jgi:hypothetical protein
MKHVNAEIDDKIRAIRFQGVANYFSQSIDYLDVKVRTDFRLRSIEFLSIAILRNLEKDIGYAKHNP